MSVNTILFDYDGTISDRTRSSYANYRILLQQFFPDMDAQSADFEARIQTCLLWDEYGTAAKKTVMEHIRRKWKPDLNIAEAVDLWYQHFPQNQIWTEDMKSVLQKLRKKYHLGLVTNGPHDRQWPKIKFMRLEELFDLILVSADFGSAKPDPAIYLEAADRLQTQPDSCAYVGDTFATDILGAIRAGMMPIWYCGEHTGITAMNITVIHKAQELLEIFT